MLLLHIAILVVVFSYFPLAFTFDKLDLFLKLLFAGSALYFKGTATPEKKSGRLVIFSPSIKV